MDFFKTIFLYTMATGYLLAGFYHFINPKLYLPMIPPYIPKPKVMNYLAGLAETVLGVGLILEWTRSYAAVGIIAMLTIFLTVHIYMVRVKGDLPGGITMPNWAAWVRLVIIHPLLIAAALWYV